MGYQKDLFTNAPLQDRSARELARTDDLDTSKEAAKKIVRQIPGIQGLVLDFAMDRPLPWTDLLLCATMRAAHGRPESTWRTRRAELVDAGLIVRAGKNDDGHSLWRITDEGRAEWLRRQG
jgi:hypothetical protein